VTQAFFPEVTLDTTPMKPIKTARYYGFCSATEHVKDFSVSKLDIAKAKIALQKNTDSLLAEKIALMRLYTEKKMSELPQPSMLYYKSMVSKHPTFNLDIIGNPRSIADAITIETSFAIAKEEYSECTVAVELNTLGDKESLARLQRELTAFYKKNWSKVPKDLKPTYKKDLFESFKATEREAVELRMLGPDPIRCLSEPSRKHFKEVLDYIENLDIPYAINHSLLGDPAYGCETVFEIIARTKSGDLKKVACGQRYNGIARKYLGKKDVSAIGAAIRLKKESFDCDEKEKTTKPKFFFIQLSLDAKLQSLHLLEILRKANISVYQSLSKDKMASQLALAEKMEIPYIIIMGKKEAMENSVLVRHMTTRCQDTVSLDELVDYAKKLK
jgi:histidyl-tRNA synthetase